MRVLGEKSVAGMDGIDVAHLGRTHDPIDLQVTVRAGRRPDANRLVGQLDVERIDIGFRVTARVRMPSSLQARMTRRAISPRLAMRIFSNI
jgi:hypothetical protein